MKIYVSCSDKLIPGIKRIHNETYVYGTVTGFLPAIGAELLRILGLTYENRETIKPKYIWKYYHQKLSSQYLHSACAIIECFAVPSIHPCLAVP